MLAGEEESAQLADLARARVREKMPALQRALEGRRTDHQRWRLRLQGEQFTFLEAQIVSLEAKIQADVTVYEQAITLCLTSPGIEEVTAANRVAAMGGNLAQFPAAQPLASWAGVCPGTHESAGKRPAGTSGKGNGGSRRSLGQAAWAAAHATVTYWAARFRRLAARKGKKRAIGAVAHTIFVRVYHMLKTNQPYRELGADYLDRLNADYLKRSLLKRLERLGVQLTVHRVAPLVTSPG